MSREPDTTDHPAIIVWETRPNPIYSTVMDLRDALSICYWDRGEAGVLPHVVQPCHDAWEEVAAASKKQHDEWRAADAR